MAVIIFRSTGNRVLYFKLHGWWGRAIPLDNRELVLSDLFIIFEESFWWLVVMPVLPEQLKSLFGDQSFRTG